MSDETEKKTEAAKDSEKPKTGAHSVAAPGTSQSASDAKVTEEQATKAASEPVSDEPVGVKPVEAATDAVGDESKKKGSGSHSADEAKPKRKKWPFILTAIVVLLAAVYVAAGFLFSSRYGFNTTINGEDCTFATLEQVEDMLGRQVDNYQLELVKIDGTNEYVWGEDVGLTMVDAPEAKEILLSQEPFLWPKRLLQPQEPYEVHPQVTIDDEKLNAAVDNLVLMTPEAQIAPTDAIPVHDDEQNCYVVQPEDWGSTINTDNIYDAVRTAMLATEPALDLKEAECYVPPQVFSDDPYLAEQVAIYNTYANFSITYIFPEGNEVLDANTVINWITIAEDGTATLDQNQVKEWLRDLASRHDTVGTPREFVTHDGSTIIVEGGELGNGGYGWAVSEKQELAAIVADFENQTSEEREPIWSATAASHDSPEWGDTYVEVSIAEQHVWYWVGGQLAFESDVVTGLPTAKRSTKTGVYQVLEKASPRVLRGDQLPDGTYEWESPVTYWMRVTWSGTGMHDANWRGSFGGQIYKSNGSHGCINMPYSKAKELYGIIEVGTPVIIY